ncbi:MAG: universal stress protein [Pseudolabrys sp.]|nr:universal stress protein [Pseudolabrys sp.]
MIKDIIVNLSLGERDPAGDFAISVAEAFDAHVLGVAFAYEPVFPATMMGGLPSDLIEAQRRESERTAKVATDRFELAAKRAGVSAETIILTNGIADGTGALAQLARRFDLTVLGQPTREEDGSDEVINEGVLFDSGRPAIFVPYIQKTGLTLNRIMVCWDGSRAAARAVADAMPLLHKAKKVEIVVVSDKGFKADEAPGADLAKHLARHGLQVELKRITSPDIDVASTILSYAADSSADMIVMGGYGHSRLRQFILGGMTRSMLESMTVLVLMSH